MLSQVKESENKFLILSKSGTSGRIECMKKTKIIFLVFADPVKTYI